MAELLDHDLSVWDRIFDTVSHAYDVDAQTVDTSSIRVHQHTGVGKRGSALNPSCRSGRRSSAMRRAFARRPDIRIAILVHAIQLPIVLELTQGQAETPFDLVEPAHFLLADNASDSDHPASIPHDPPPKRNGTHLRRGKAIKGVVPAWTPHPSVFTITNQHRAVYPTGPRG